MSYTRSSATFGHRVRKTAVGSTEHRIRTRTRTRNASDLASDSHAMRSVGNWTLMIWIWLQSQSVLFVRSSERKSIVTNSKFYLQFNMTLCTLVTMQVEDATQGLGVNEINDEWMSVMIPYWDNIRNNKWVDSLIMMIYWWKRSSPEGRENFEVSPFLIVGS